MLKPDEPTEHYSPSPYQGLGSQAAREVKAHPEAHWTRYHAGPQSGRCDPRPLGVSSWSRSVPTGCLPDLGRRPREERPAREVRPVRVSIAPRTAGVSRLDTVIERRRPLVGNQHQGRLTSQILAVRVDRCR